MASITLSDITNEIDARQYHELVYNRIDGRTETYDEVQDSQNWPDFEGGADPIAAALGMEVLFQSNDGADTFFNAKLREIYDTYVAECQDEDREYTNTARVYQLFRDHPLCHTVVFTCPDSFGQESRDVFYMAKPEDIPAIGSTLAIALPLMSEDTTIAGYTLYEIADLWFDEYRDDLVEQLVRNDLTTLPDAATDMLNAAESSAWNNMRESKAAFGFGPEQENTVAELLAEWAQVGRYAREIEVSEKQAVREKARSKAA